MTSYVSDHHAIFWLIIFHQDTGADKVKKLSQRSTDACIVRIAEASSPQMLDPFINVGLQEAIGLIDTEEWLSDITEGFVELPQPVWSKEEPYDEFK